MKKIVWLIVISLCLGFWLSCSGMAAEPIKIAIIFAKTGVAANDDVASLRFVNLAVEEINNKGGISGRPIEAIELDNKSTPIGSKEAALKAVKLNVTAVIGASWSSHSLGMAPTLQKAGIPMISPLSTDPKVTLVGDYIFRACFTDPFQGKVMAAFAKRDLKARTAVILVNVNNDYSMGLAGFFKKYSLRYGLKILYEGKYADRDTDFTKILKETKTLQPDVIFLPSYPRDSGLVIKQARAMGINSIFLGGDGWSNDMYEYVGKVIEGSYFCNHWNPEVSFAKGKQVQKDYLQKFKEGTGVYAPLPYDAVMLLADAITRAGSLDRKKIRDALAATKNFEGATGTITFDEKRNPLNKEAVILKFDKGTAVFVKSIKPQ